MGSFAPKPRIDMQVFSLSEDAPGVAPAAVFRVVYLAPFPSLPIPAQTLRHEPFDQIKREALRTALGRSLNLPAIGSAAGLLFGLLVIKVLAFVVDQATRWTPVVLAHVVLARLLLGLLAT
jgi:hypothetical protein